LGSRCTGIELEMADVIFHDPLGRQVVLHSHTWHGHILKRHPEMQRHRILVELAITDPIEIRLSVADVDCRLYFGAGPKPGIMVAVVADVSRGFIKTAHVVKAAKGALEWSKQMP
jgi:hypothetical protein